MHRNIRVHRVLLIAGLFALLPLGRVVVAADAPAADEQTIKRLTTALLNGTPAERLAAAKDIAALKAAGKPAIPALLKAMEFDTDPKVRLQLGNTLYHVGLGDSSEVDELIRIIKAHPDSDPSLSASLRLAEWGLSGNAAAEKAIPLMIDSLRSQNVGTRLGAILFLSTMPAKIGDAEAMLTKLANNDPEPKVQVNAIGALAMYHDIVDPLCGKFEGDNISFDFHRGGTDEYGGTIHKGKAAFKCLARRDGDHLKGTFTTPDGGSFDFTLTADGTSVVLKTGATSYNAKKQPKKTDR